MLAQAREGRASLGGSGSRRCPGSGRCRLLPAPSPAERDHSENFGRFCGKRQSEARETAVLFTVGGFDRSEVIACQRRVPSRRRLAC
jgi:hypothetical protein